MIFVIIILILGLGIFSYFQFFRTSDDSSARIAAAKDLLSSNCDELTNMSTEYIKKNWAANTMKFIEENRCNCVIEILAPKMADKYSLQELLDLKNKPIHDIQAITEIIEANKDDVMKCLTFQK